MNVSSPESECREHSSSSERATVRQRHPSHRLPRHEPVPQRRFPDGERAFVRLTARDDRQDVLDGIDERIRMPRHERSRPMHPSAVLHLADMPMRRCRDVDRAVAEHPEPEPFGLGEAGEHDPGARGRHQQRIGVRQRDPAVAWTDQRPRRNRLLDRPARHSGGSQRGDAHHTARRGDGIPHASPSPQTPAPWSASRAPTPRLGIARAGRTAGEEARPAQKDGDVRDDGRPGPAASVIVHIDANARGMPTPERESAPSQTRRFRGNGCFVGLDTRLRRYSTL